MQHKANTWPKTNQTAGILWRSIATRLFVAALLFLALYNLTSYPVTWFDEGSHLHVPKTLVRFGVYADYSSEGFRYYGPTIGLGPTVMLPVAAAFRLFGIGLLQARLVMVVYLLAAVYVMYSLARQLGGYQLAWVAIALLVTSQGVALLEYGRQVLGEVPGLFFLIAGMSLWFTTWEKASWRLGLVGLFFGLAIVTKYQYLLVVMPTLGLAWFANLVYYRTAPQRVFIVPGLVAAACFAVWQTYMLLYLGPATITENLAMFRQFTSGAALVFSPDSMRRAVTEVLSWKVYLGALLPALVYGFTLALPRRREGQQWGLLIVLVTVNLVWYVFASIGWLRYAFPSLAVSSLFVARFFHDLTDGFTLEARTLWAAVRQGQPIPPRSALRAAVLAWLALTLILPLGETVKGIVFPAFNAPAAMAAYLNENVPGEALIETWEPEMGFLTDHNYHFPPPLLLNQAVGYMWLEGPELAPSYPFVEEQSPAFVLVGAFARWVKLYPEEVLAERYQLVTRIGGYELYSLR